MNDLEKAKANLDAARKEVDAAMTAETDAREQLKRASDKHARAYCHYLRISKADASAPAS